MENLPPFDLFNPAPEYHSVVAESTLPIPVLIPGLEYRSGFITVDQELALLSSIAEQPWLGDLKRRVQHYGWKYDYRARTLNYDMYLGPLPAWIKFIAEKLVQEKLIQEEPDQVIINEYKPGQGIANHVDCEPCFGNTIISLSLGSACAMNFIELSSKTKQEFILHPRSVVAISEQSRYQWSHGIPARLADEIDGVRVNRGLRVSMTFRKTIL
ncbi:alpha-ketoglutarate-dependent dioxygenase AlkB [Pedobacter sp. MR2016-24]|uniref:alpha-ketoglutarate-dependent dioxygenase AlkB n=1 Tax=Pedobacter sp. MR2016-24 TaxID=2994466 RepID=UPI002248136B|nr:alpha-ketoglutarate-dependent dioxygenase AlkB [Pedobacter sp. MR2016-24]MCX2485705.1 alpha-ketoglutarate-dependent dioxygenase AlkB [Pedobacter sp. MR2016-24]